MHAHIARLVVISFKSCDLCSFVSVSDIATNATESLVAWGPRLYSSQKLWFLHSRSDAFWRCLTAAHDTLYMSVQFKYTFQLICFNSTRYEGNTCAFVQPEIWFGYCVVSWLRSAPVVCFGSSSVFQFLFGYLGRCSCSFTSIDTLSAWCYDFQVCSGWWSHFNEYLDEFDCRKCLRCLAAELDFNPAGFTVVVCASEYAWPVYNTRRNTLIWPAVAVHNVALVVEVASSMPNWSSNLEATLRFLTLLLTGGTP